MRQRILNNFQTAVKKDTLPWVALPQQALSSRRLFNFTFNMPRFLALWGFSPLTSDRTGVQVPSPASPLKSHLKPKYSVLTKAYPIGPDRLFLRPGKAYLRRLVCSTLKSDLGSRKKRKSIARYSSAVSGNSLDGGRLYRLLDSVTNLALITGMFLMLCLILPNSSYAHPVDLSIISQIESSNNPKAIGPSGEIGLFQISKDLLKHYNQFHGTTYLPGWLFDSANNRRVADWYFEYLFQHTGTLKDTIIAYNFGLSNWKKFKRGQVGLPDVTKRYLVKYETKRKKGVRDESYLFKG